MCIKVDLSEAMLGTKYTILYYPNLSIIAVIAPTHFFPTNKFCGEIITIIP